MDIKDLVNSLNNSFQDVVFIIHDSPNRLEEINFGGPGSIRDRFEKIENGILVIFTGEVSMNQFDLSYPYDLSILINPNIIKNHSSIVQAIINEIKKFGNIRVNTKFEGEKLQQNTIRYTYEIKIN